MFVGMHRIVGLDSPMPSLKGGERGLGAHVAGASPKRPLRGDVECPPIEIRFDLSRSELQILLEGFLTGALGVELIARLDQLDDLPSSLPYARRACTRRRAPVDCVVDHEWTDGRLGPFLCSGVPTVPGVRTAYLMVASLKRSTFGLVSL